MRPAPVDPDDVGVGTFEARFKGGPLHLIYVTHDRRVLQVQGAAAWAVAAVTAPAWLPVVCIFGAVMFLFAAVAFLGFALTWAMIATMTAVDLWKHGRQ